jgi:mannosyl-3-phosphoglycerate phosphatase
LFSDVDGTLLDANDRLAITAAHVARIAGDVELILASSRTLVELGAIQRRLGFSAPLIAENGAVVAFPPRWRGSESTRRHVTVLGRPATELRPLVRQAAREASVELTDQRDLTSDRGRALRRTHSICVLNWLGPGADRFLGALERRGLEATRSGEWITITRGADKGSAVRAVLDQARRQRRPFATTVAIGNAANDVALLAAASVRFSIRNPRRGHDPGLRALSGVTLLSSSGRRAWREALAFILPTRPT